MPVCGRQLTAALLEADYGVRGWWVPEGHLVPPVTNRANYIHWLEDLLALSSPPGALSGCMPACNRGSCDLLRPNDMTENRVLIALAHQ